MRQKPQHISGAAGDTAAFLLLETLSTAAGLTTGCARGEATAGRLSGNTYWLPTPANGTASGIASGKAHADGSRVNGNARCVAMSGPLTGPLLGSSGPLLVSGLLDGGPAEGMKGLIRDDTSWSINLGDPSLVFVPAVAVSGITLAIRVAEVRPETDQHAGGARGPGTHPSNRPGPRSSTTPARPPAASLVSRSPRRVFFRRVDWLGVSKLPQLRAASPIPSPLGRRSSVHGSRIHAQVRTWNLTAPPSCCKHETQGVLPEPASGPECECAVCNGKCYRRIARE